MSTVTDTITQPGSLSVIATDTVYGVVACASDTQAVKRLYELKKREAKPGTLIAATIEDLVGLGIKRRYLVAVQQFWPGAVSVIIPAADPALAYLHQGKMSLAIRIPDDPRLHELLKQTGPLLTSSANQPGKPPATTIAEAKAYFGNKIDFYNDYGDISGRQPSTIIRVVDDAIEVIRPGAVHIRENE